MGLILLILFLITAGLVTYAILRKKTIPIGFVGLVLCLNSRTRRVFDEGYCAVPFFCTIKLLEVKDHVAHLPTEDIGCGDGFKIVTKGAIARYRLRQIIPIGSGKRFRTSFKSFVRRFIPYTMDSRTAEFLNMETAVHALVPVKAQSAISAFCGSKRHDSILGYHVIRFVDAIITTGGVPAKDPNETVIETRLALLNFVIEALTKEFESAGLEIVSFTIDDYDPDEKAKAHIDEAQEKIREIQVRRLQTSAEVARALEIANAAMQFAKEHPGSDLGAYYGLMREKDNNQIGAENLSVLGQILQALHAKLQTSTPMVPLSAPTGPAGSTAAA